MISSTPPMPLQELTVRIARHNRETLLRLHIARQHSSEREELRNANHDLHNWTVEMRVRYGRDK